LTLNLKNGLTIAVISDITLDELSDAPQNVQEIFNKIPEDNLEIIISDNESRKLADLYVLEGVVSKKYYEDALHIAISTINQVNVLASWNFKHIVNLERIRLYNAVNLKNGYSMLEIRNPREILKFSEDEEYGKNPGWQGVLVVWEILGEIDKNSKTPSIIIPTNDGTFVVPLTAVDDEKGAFAVASEGGVCARYNGNSGYFPLIKKLGVEKLVGTKLSIVEYDPELKQKIVEVKVTNSTKGGVKIGIETGDDKLIDKL
jgi:hypothetical protein